MKAKLDKPPIRGLLTVREFAQATGWKESTVRDKVYKRELDYIKLGKSVRFRPETLDALIQQGAVPAKPYR